MIHRVRILAAATACALMCGAAVSHAQTCLGCPAFATGPVNVSAMGLVGGRFWGAGADVNFGRPRGGAFGGVSVGSVSFIDAPTETRFSYSATAAYESHRRDQLIWCPLVSATLEQGNDVNLGGGRHSRTDGYVVGIGLGASGELQGRGRFSVDPFVTARYEEAQTRVSGDSTNKTTEHGIAFGVGLGFRLRDAIQVTPNFSGATFPGSDLVFQLRVSLALEFGKRQTK